MKYAFQTPWGYFLPYSTYSTWREENERWRSQYFALRDEIVEQYPLIVEKLLAQYEPIGRHSYQLLRSHAPEVLERRGLRSEDEFLVYFRDEIRSAINSPEQISASFVYKADLKRIDLPDVLSPERQSVSDQQVEEAALAQQQEQLEALEREREAKKLANFFHSPLPVHIPFLKNCITTKNCFLRYAFYCWFMICFEAITSSQRESCMRKERGRVSRLHFLKKLGIFSSRAMNANERTPCSRIIATLFARRSEKFLGIFRRNEAKNLATSFV